MPAQRLQQLLQQLHQEVEALGNQSSLEKIRLEQLIQEIEQALTEQDHSELHASVLDGLRAKLAGLEADHPTAAGVVRRLMQTLSDMGI